MGEEKNQRAKEPSIRTMRSDMAEFLRKTKPSLVALLSRQAQADEARGFGPRDSRFSALKIILAVIILALAAAGGFFLYQYLRPRLWPQPPPAPSPVSFPPSFIFFESVTETVLDQEQRALASLLKKAGEESQPAGTFRRIVIRSRNETAGNPVIETGSFFGLMSDRVPAGFLKAARGLPQFFIYQQSSGPRFGVMAEVSDSGLAIGAFSSWEPSMQKDLELFFLGSPPPATFDGFQSLTYKNLDFRYLKIERDRDAGLGYLYFPARRLIIIATSEEAIHLAINRLLESR